MGLPCPRHPSLPLVGIVLRMLDERESLSLCPSTHVIPVGLAAWWIDAEVVTRLPDREFSGPELGKLMPLYATC